MRDLPVQGFSVYWGKPGLTVEAIDYHSTELLLGWDYILGLAEAVQRSSGSETSGPDAESAQENPVRKNRGLGTGDVCGKLL